MIVNIDNLISKGTIEGVVSDLGPRHSSIIRTIELLAAIKPKVMVETGTTSTDLLYEYGMSTLIFGAYAKLHNAILHSVDYNDMAIGASKWITRNYRRYIEYHTSGSIDFLKAFNKKIDFLYLDSYAFRKGYEEQSRKHQLGEIKAAESKLARPSLILTNDSNIRPWSDRNLNDMDAQGKTYLSHQYILDMGASCILDIPSSQRLYYLK